MQAHSLCHLTQVLVNNSKACLNDGKEEENSMETELCLGLVREGVKRPDCERESCRKQNSVGRVRRGRAQKG